MNVYKWIYTYITPWLKRPWTFVYRDIWHKYEWFPQMQWAFTGIMAEFVRQLLDWPWWIHLVWVGIYTYGYINGHFFWGKEYQEGQGG